MTGHSDVALTHLLFDALFAHVLEELFPRFEVDDHVGNMLNEGGKGDSGSRLPMELQFGLKVSLSQAGYEFATAPLTTSIDRRRRLNCTSDVGLSILSTSTFSSHL